MITTSENYLQELLSYSTTLPAWLTNSINFQAPSDHDDETKKALVTTNQNGKNVAFQRWFHFKEAFSPQFVADAINSLGYKPTHIIDPFGGSGTSALTAQLMGIDATTIEVNPFICDIIRTKLSKISAETLRSHMADFRAHILKAPIDFSIYDSLPATFIETSEKERWIFSKEVAGRISQYIHAINKISSKEIKRLFKVTLGSVLVDCSNVYINGKGRRYRSNWSQSQTNAEILDTKFSEQMNLIFEDVVKFENRPNCNVTAINGDSRTEIAKLSKPADLIIFSPPYPNSFDYTDIYNIELWMLGYLITSQDNKNLRNHTLRSHVQIRREHTRPQYVPDALSTALIELEVQKNNLWDADIPNMIGSYFHDLETILKHCKDLLTTNGKVLMVVGDSKYANTKINVSEILMDISRSLGYSRVSSREVRQMRTSSQQGGALQLAESVVELQL